MSKFQKGRGDWVQYRTLPNLNEVDFHWSDNGPREVDYYEGMGQVYKVALESIERAYESGETQYVMFTHGWSTSRPGRTTSRSVIRGLMRSKAATPYICRKECIQHGSVFVSAIRPGGGVVAQFEIPGSGSV